MTPPKNILLSAQAFPPRSGGIQTLMASLAAQASEDAKVQVFADGDKAARAYDAANPPPYSITRFGGPKPLRRRSKARRVGATPAELIFLDSWKSAEHLPSGITAPVLCYAHGNEFPVGDALAARPRKPARITRALAKCDHVLAVSSATADRLKSFLPADNAPQVHVVPNPVAPPAPITEDARKWAQAQWPEDTHHLLCLSRLTPWKGVDRAIETLAELRALDYPAHLVIAGEGEDKDRLERIARGLNIEGAVSFIGRIEGAKKSALYARADLYLQPGRSENGECEGFGITYLEAALAGTPAISGNQGGAPEAVQDEQTGLVVDGTDQNAVTYAVRRILDDDALAAQMGTAAKAHAQTRTWPAQMNALLALAAAPALDTAKLDI